MTWYSAYLWTLNNLSTCSPIIHHKSTSWFRLQRIHRCEICSMTTYIFKLILWNSFYSSIEFKVFPGSNKLKQSIKLRAIPNLTGESNKKESIRSQPFLTLNLLSKLSILYEMIQEHHDIHADEQPSGLILYLYQKYMQFHHWDILHLTTTIWKTKYFIFVSFHYMKEIIFYWHASCFGLVNLHVLPTEVRHIGRKEQENSFTRQHWQSCSFSGSVSS